MNSNRFFKEIFGLGLTLSLLGLPCTGQAQCSSSTINYKTLEQLVQTRPLKEVLQSVRTDRVQFLWCSEYANTLSKKPKVTLTEADINELKDAVDQNYCEPGQTDQLIRLRGSSTLGYTLAPWLTYKYLNNLGASGVQMIFDCDGKHTRVIGNHDGWIVFDIVATESDAGGSALSQGAAEIAMASKKLDELPSKFQQKIVAQDDMSVIVNKLNPLDRIKIEQLQAIVLGKLTKWRDLGINMISCGASDTIVLYSRPSGSGTLSDFLDAIGVKESDFNSNNRLPPNQIVKNHLEMAYNVAKNGCSIGYVSQPYANMAKVIPVVAPKEVGLSREIYFYHGARNYYRADIGRTVEAFMEYTMDIRRGQRDIKDMGYDTNPVSDEFDCKREVDNLPKGTRVGRILFSFNSTVIDREGFRRLNELKSQILHSVTSEVWVVGFTDDVGTPAKNQVLSEERAKAVQQHFPVSQKPLILPPKGCGVRPYGNDTGQGRFNNRAVEVWWR